MRIKQFAQTVFVAAVLMLPFEASATDHQWNRYHWEKTTSGAVALTVGDCHTSGSGWSAILNNVLTGAFSLNGYVDADPNVDNWSDAGSPTYVSLQQVACNSSTAKIKSYNASYGDTGWLGLASISIYLGKDKHIAKGETKVNDYYKTAPSGYDGFNESIEWYHVLCQEVGHTIGVDHVVGATCMNTEERPLRYPEPNTNDALLLSSPGMYGHVHSGGGGGKKGGPPPGGAGPPSGLAKAFWAEQHDTLEEMFSAADAVVDVTVLSSAFDRHVGRGPAAVPVSRVVLRVNAVLSGVAARVIVLEQTRGPDLEVVDDPGYVVNDNYILYLRRLGANTFRTVNPQGRTRY